MALLPRVRRGTLATPEMKAARHREYARAWRLANLDKDKATRERGKVAAREHRKVYRKRAKKKIDDTRRAYVYLRSYGLTLEQYQQMLRDQNYRCAICQCEEWETRFGRLEVDHCHAGGRVRGLLCSKCNTMLGLANDRAEVLVMAISYLDARVSL